MNQVLFRFSQVGAGKRGTFLRSGDSGNVGWTFENVGRTTTELGDGGAREGSLSGFSRLTCDLSGGLPPVWAPVSPVA